MMACPERDQLDLLLAKRLADTAREELKMHVEGCAACQALSRRFRRDAPTAGVRERRDGVVVANRLQPLSRDEVDANRSRWTPGIPRVGFRSPELLDPLPVSARLVTVHVVQRSARPSSAMTAGRSSHRGGPRPAALAIPAGSAASGSC
jgi:hypothetical protein